MKKLCWLDKLNESLASAIGDDIREKIMQGSEGLTSGSGPGRKAAWVQSAMERMDALLDEETRINVMERCSCDFESRKKIAREVYASSRDIDDFIDRIQRQGNICNKLVREGNILYSIKERGCDCGWVRAAKTPVSPTFCNCSKGYIAKLFAAIFQKPVRVDVVQSVVRGDAVCKFAIYLD